MLQEVSPGPGAEAIRLSAFVATSITIQERTWVKEMFKACKQPAELFDMATACDERAKQAGDVGSALVVLQLGAVLKLSPVRVAKGELELIPPKLERWKEDALEAFRLGRPIRLSFAGQKQSKKSRKRDAK